mmetsp:Transcript_18571/g.74631  ORF Transcript_18571/g.74631 Transcript_18571/m.74631 type:complete len:209 (-) Transcript_18571:893-1519(-)
MEVRVCICRHVIVDHNVHSLNIDPPAKNVRRHKNSLLEVLERFVARDSLRLRKPSVHSNRRKVALHKQFVQLRASGYVLYENHNLIELKRIQQVVELTVLFCLLQLQEVLKQSMQCQLRLVVNVNFHWVLHKFFANYSDLLRKGSGEHHHLLVMWGHSEDILETVPNKTSVSTLSKGFGGGHGGPLPEHLGACPSSPTSCRTRQERRT